MMWDSASIRDPKPFLGDILRKYTRLYLERMPPRPLGFPALSCLLPSTPHPIDLRMSTTSNPPLLGSLRLAQRKRRGFWY